MESQWEFDRIRLFQLRQAHPDWTLARLAQALDRSLSWVKKWLKRFREAGKSTLAMFQSRSRAPHHRQRQVEIQGLIGHTLPFEDYLSRMLREARTLSS